MSVFAGRNRSDLKAHNLQAVLRAFLHEQTLARVELARRTALSATTITNLVGDLLEQGIVAEDEEVSPARGGVGRPRRLLRLLPDARFVLAVHIGIGMYRVAIANLRAEIRNSLIGKYDVGAPAGNVLAAIAVDIRRTIAESGIPQELLLGVGVGASGLVDPRLGMNVFAPRLGWRQVPISGFLHEQLQLPVCVENNVRAMALGEALFGAGRGSRTLAFVYGRIGVGAGLVVHGKLFRGSAYGAGEIGHMIMLPTGGDVCSCGRRGCLETLISEHILVEEARRLAAREPQGMLAQFLQAEGEEKPVSRLFAAARAGDQAAQRLIRDRAQYLGLALANLVNLFNPDRIIVGGMLAEGADLILPTADAVMRTMALDSLGESVQLLATPAGWRAGIIGAAGVALLNLFYASTESV